jgi:alpha-ribazole phosphatase
VGPRRTLIYLLRHGEIAGAAGRRFVGHLDVPLSVRGERQCVRQAERLRTVPLAAVIASDLERARRSAEIIAAPHGLRPQIVPALREMDMGRWDGLTAAEIGEREPGAFAAWMAHIGEFAFPGGESVPALLARAWPAFEALTRTFAGRSIAIVAHGGTNRALLCQILGLPLGRILGLGQDYGALTVLEQAGDGWCVRRLNERPPAEEDVS